MDNTDNSILGNDSVIRLKKVFIPTLNQKLSYTLKFNNAIYHPHSGYKGAFESTSFSITDEQNVERSNCKIKDNEGILIVYRMDTDGSEITVRENIGTINYITGKIVLNSFDPSSYEGSDISVTVIPVLNDVASLREQLITIQEKDINLKMNDISVVRTAQHDQLTTTETTTTTSTTQTTSVNY